MQFATVVAFFVVVFIALVAAGRQQCQKQMFRGCKLSYGECVCEKTKTCENPFPYSSKKECQNDVEGKNDKCAEKPCRHGSCAQVKKDDARTWYCQCAGSGYYGPRCQYKCPEKVAPMPMDFPTACVMTD